MTASHTDASTRSDSISISALRPVPSGAVARRPSGTPRPCATRAHEAPLTACARTLVSRPAPWCSKRGKRCVDTARLSTTSPRNASRSYDSARCSTQDAWVKACRRRSSGSSRSRSARLSHLRGMGGDEVRGLADRQYLGSLLVGNADAVAVLELDDELHEVEGVGLEVLPEAGALLDAGRVDLELRGQVLANALQDLLAGHDPATLAAGTDLNAPAASRAAAVRVTMSSSTALRASWIALAIPRGPKLPCATTTGLRSPSRIAPPNASGSSSPRSGCTRFRISRPPTVDTRPERTASLIASRTVRAVASITFSATLPVKPSVTITSAPAPGRSNPSRFPTKLRLPSASRSCAASTSGVPLPCSSPTDSSPTRGRSMPYAASMKHAPM